MANVQDELFYSGDENNFENSLINALAKAV